MKFRSLCLLLIAVSTSCAAESSLSSAVDETQNKINKLLNEDTSEAPSVLQQKLHQESKLNEYPFNILLYRPNYIMPFYYSTRAVGPVSATQAWDRPMKHVDFKYQFSFKLPVWENMFHIGHKPVSLNISYTQLAYWQLYVNSAYFRETNYEPQIFLTSNLRKNWLLNLGLDHQSNGRGDTQERSWNRAFFDLTGSRDKWLVSIEPWILIFKEGSSDIHNPDITKYLGHERIVGAYLFPHNVQVSLKLQNIERPGLMSEQLAVSYRLNKHFQLYVQGFHGYGQSLIEYNHKTYAYGIGLSLNNWL